VQSGLIFSIIAFRILFSFM